jgi:hypothetical protein
MFGWVIILTLKLNPKICIEYYIMKVSVAIAILLVVVSCHTHYSAIPMNPNAFNPTSSWSNNAGRSSNFGGSSFTQPGYNRGSSGWPNTGGSIRPGSGIYRPSTSLSGITCSSGHVNPSSLGRAFYSGPTRMTCISVGGRSFSDVCTSLQQCANLMCSKYVRCPGRTSMSSAWRWLCATDSHIIGVAF